MSITIHPSIWELLSNLLNLQERGRVYIPTVENLRSNELQELCLNKNMRVSTACADKNQIEIGSHFGSTRLSCVYSANPHYIKPLDSFHYGLAVPNFDLRYDAGKLVAKPRLVQDNMLQFKCSEGADMRLAQEHIVNIEQLMLATICGGFFAAILPPRWFGRSHRYMKWFDERAARVAKIKLPYCAVHHNEIDCKITPSNLHQEYAFSASELETRLSTGNYELWIWFKPYSFDNLEILPKTGQYQSQLEWATRRFSTFQHKLADLSHNELDSCLQSFKKTDWYGHSVYNFVKTANRVLVNSPAYGMRGNSPIVLPNTEEIAFIEPTEKNAISVKTVKSLDALRRISHAIHVKVTRSKIKLQAYRASSLGALHDIIVSDGLETTKSGLVYPKTHEILRQEYQQVAEKLVSKIEEHGCIPVMLESEAAVIRRRQRWLDIQLTPIERKIPITIVSNDASGSPTSKIEWETLYDDSGMWATFPELMKLWEQRALKMRMDKWLMPYQLNDVLISCAKQSVFNANVMGLGKTREVCFSALLRGVKRVLIIVPASLIGTWQDEIEGVMLPYIRTVRRHWSGRLLQVGMPKIIEYARDCLEENLSYFNLVSYDRLKMTPRDGRFYKCPQCNCVVYSPNGVQQMCPGRADQYDPDPLQDASCVGPYRRWKLACASRVEETNKLKYQKQKVQISTGNQVHWNPEHPSRKNIPESDTKIIDYRTEIPTVIGTCSIPLMEEMDMMYSKMTIESGGIDEKGQPKLIATPRKPHVTWTISELLRGKFPFVAADEALYVKNEESQRSQATVHINGRIRQCLTGTPLKGNPQSILPYLNWNIPRAAWPDYRSYEIGTNGAGGTRRFMKKYETIVKIDGTEEENEDGETVFSGGTSKQIPKINNPELFQADLAGFMIRHTREEPDVKNAMPRIPLFMHDIELEMDQQHRQYYANWLEKFAEWWQKMKEEEEGKKTGGDNNLLAKISYLVGASADPHHMLDGISQSKDQQLRQWALIIGKYQGPVTAKMKYARSLVKEAIKKGIKTLAFSTRNSVLNIQQAWSERNSIGSMIVNGEVPLRIDKATGRSIRHSKVQDFRFKAYDVLWGGIGSLKEGMNIPEASQGIVSDYPWEPADVMQALGRMMRLPQNKPVNAYMLMHKGTIDNYMAALCYLKGRSHSEGIDYMEFDDFTVDLIPDFQQYANAIVDGTEEKMKRKMWCAVQRIKDQMKTEGDDI